MREKQREMDTANMGPGANYVDKPFGSDITQKVNFGSKYEFKPDKNPAPGTYDADEAYKKNHHRSYQTYFLSSEKKEGVLIGGKEPGNDIAGDPGAYTKDIITMGKGLNNVTMGSKYEFKADKNPAPGQYDADKAIEATKPKLTGGVI